MKKGEITERKRNSLRMKEITTHHTKKFTKVESKKRNSQRLKIDALG